LIGHERRDQPLAHRRRQGPGGAHRVSGVGIQHHQDRRRIGWISQIGDTGSQLAIHPDSLPNPAAARKPAGDGLIFGLVRRGLGPTLVGTPKRGRSAAVLYAADRGHAVREHLPSP
jgi:hypothetical protein